MTWADKLTELTARINALTAQRNELSAHIGADGAPLWGPKVTQLTAMISLKTTERDSLAVLLAGLQDPALIAQVAALTASLAASQASVTAANATIATRDATIATYLATIATSAATIAARDATIVVRDAQIETRDLNIVALNAQITNLNGQIQALLDQLASLDPYKAFDEMRVGDVSMWGFEDILVVYEAEMIRPGDTATSPPNTTFLNTFFGGLRSANGDVRLVLDYESWVLVTGSNNTLAANPTIVAYYVTLVNAAKAHFSDVGLYGEIPTRQYTYLNYPVGHATYTSRKNAVDSTNVTMQPMWDAVTAIYPSLYLLAPVHTDQAKLDLWLTDNAAACALHAPGKKVYPFVSPWNHSSLNLPDYYMPGAYFYDLLNKVYDRFDGYAMWLFTSDAHPDTLSPIPDWWPYTKQFQSEKGLY